MDVPDVLVIGAGPTGLTLACSLLLHGVTVRVVDRAQGPAVTSRANFLHARGSEMLGRLGALGTLPEESLRGMQITTYLGDRPMMNLRFGDVAMRTAAPPMVVSQARTEAALLDRLAVLGDGQVVRAGWLVGCDGTGSTTRKLAGIDFPGVKVSERFLLADLRLDWDLDRSGTSGWIHPRGMIGAMPMPAPGGADDLWRLIAYDPGYDEKPSGPEILERFRQILSRRTGRAVRIGDAEWLSLFTVHRRLADTYRQGRILLAGDAANAHAPFGGQRMLTGVGDAENLAWKLALVVRGAAEGLIDTYEAEHRPLATDVLRGTSAVTKLNIANNPIGRFLRDRVAVSMFNLPRVQRWATYTTSQLWVSYRKGPLGGRGRKPRPGDRVPGCDATCEDGKPTRLHAELGGRWALVAPSGGSFGVVAAARRRLGELVGVLRYDSEDAMLVRPDAHLAWRGDPSGPSGLGRRLDIILRGGQ